MGTYFPPNNTQYVVVDADLNRVIKFGDNFQGTGKVTDYTWDFNTHALLGLTNEPPATSDTADASINQLLKRHLQQQTRLVSLIRPIDSFGTNALRVVGEENTKVFEGGAIVGVTSHVDVGVAIVEGYRMGSFEIHNNGGTLTGFRIYVTYGIVPGENPQNDPVFMLASQPQHYTTETGVALNNPMKFVHSASPNLYNLPSGGAAWLKLNLDGSTRSIRFTAAASPNLNLSIGGTLVK